MDAKVKEQILAIRDTGAVNMLDIKGVERLAYEMNCFDLVLFIEENKKKYINFIFFGEE